MSCPGQADIEPCGKDAVAHDDSNVHRARWTRPPGPRTNVLGWIRWWAASLFVMASASSFAVTPLTPRFDRPTQALVLEQLGRAHVPSVGQNSVVIAILSALGSEPRAAVFQYDEPYPHLPTVDVTSRVEAGCSSVSAVVRGAAEAGYARVLVTGVFCMVGPARWSSKDFAAMPASDR